MRFFGRLIGLTIAVLFVLIQPLAMWTFNLQRILLDSNTYKQVFDDKDFYEESVPRVLPALLSGLESISMQAEAADEISPDAASDTESMFEADPEANQITLLGLIEHLDDRAWQQIAPMFVSTEWVEQETQKNLDEVMHWLDGGPTLDITFDTSPLSQHLAGEAGQAGVHEIINALPLCTSEQEAQLDAYFGGATNTAVAYCQPQDEDLLAEFTAASYQACDEAAAMIPATLDVISEMRAITEEQHETEPGSHPPIDPFTDNDMDRFRATVQLWRNLLPLTFMLPLGMIALIIIFAIRSKKSFFRWIGWSLIIGSLITLAPLYMLPFLVPELSVDAEIEEGFAVGGKLIAELAGHRMFKTMISAFTWPVLIESAILILTGFVFVVLSVLVNDPDSQLTMLLNAPPSQTPALMPQFQTPVGYHVYQPPSGSTPSPDTRLPHGGGSPEQQEPPSENTPI